MLHFSTFFYSNKFIYQSIFSIFCIYTSQSIVKLYDRILNTSQNRVFFAWWKTKTQTQPILILLPLREYRHHQMFYTCTKIHPSSHAWKRTAIIMRLPAKTGKVTAIIIIDNVWLFNSKDFETAWIIKLSAHSLWKVLSTKDFRR